MLVNKTEKLKIGKKLFWIYFECLPLKLISQTRGTYNAKLEKEAFGVLKGSVVEMLIPYYAIVHF